MNKNIPYIECFVRDAFLFSDFDNKDLTPCYAFGVKTLINKPLTFIVQLNNGAVFQNLPIHSLVHRKDFISPATSEKELLSILQYWNMQSSSAEVITYSYLEGYTVDCYNRNKQWMRGTYLFTIDDYYADANSLKVGYANDTDSKSFNIIKLVNGFFAAYPNNFLRFHNLNFVDAFPKESPPKYKANVIDWNCEFNRFWAHVDLPGAAIV